MPLPDNNRRTAPSSLCLTSLLHTVISLSLLYNNTVSLWPEASQFLYFPVLQFLCSATSPSYPKILTHFFASQHYLTTPKHQTSTVQHNFFSLQHYHPCFTALLPLLQNIYLCSTAQFLFNSTALQLFSALYHRNEVLNLLKHRRLPRRSFNKNKVTKLTE